MRLRIPRKSGGQLATMALALALGGTGLATLHYELHKAASHTPAVAREARPCRSLQHCLASSNDRMENLPHYGIVERATGRYAQHEKIAYRTQELRPLTYAIISRESQFDRLAVGDAGEIGLMQVLYDDVHAKYGPRLAAIKRKHPGKKGPQRQAYLAEVKPVKDAIRREYAQRFAYAASIGEGVRRLTNCAAHAEATLGHSGPHRHTPAEDARWRRLTMAYYNAGKHGVDRRLARLTSMKTIHPDLLHKLKLLPETTRHYIVHVDKDLLQIREHYRPAMLALQNWR